jgi:curved DNA-binding protein CbpA
MDLQLREDPPLRDLEMMNHYELLGVAEDASVRDIKKAHRNISLQCHPDKTLEKPDDVRVAATEKLKLVNEASAVLCDKGLRAEYDKYLWECPSSELHYSGPGRDNDDEEGSDGDGSDGDGSDEDGSEEDGSEEDNDDEEEGAQGDVDSGGGDGVTSSQAEEEEGEEEEEVGGVAGGEVHGDDGGDSDCDEQGGSSSSSSSSSDLFDGVNGPYEAITIFVGHVEKQSSCLEKVAEFVTKEFASPEEAQEKSADIRAAIRNGFSAEEQDLVGEGGKRKRQKNGGSLTEEEGGKRAKRLSAQKKEQGYYSRIFKAAFHVPWGLNGRPKGTPAAVPPNPDAPTSPTGGPGDEWFIYVLSLTGGKYYVGLTKNYSKGRLAAHFSETSGKGAKWTKRHKPIQGAPVFLRPVAPGSPRFDEDKETKEQMKKHGIKNVRGGSHCSLRLREYVVKTLTHELRHESNACLRCGSGLHWYSNCAADSAVEEEECLLSQSS